LKSRIPEEKFLDLPKARIEAQKEFQVEEQRIRRIRRYFILAMYLTLTLVLILVFIYSIQGTSLLLMIQKNIENIFFGLAALIIFIPLLMARLLSGQSIKNIKETENKINSISDWEKLKIYAKIEIDQENAERIKNASFATLLKDMAKK